MFWSWSFQIPNNSEGIFYLRLEHRTFAECFVHIHIYIHPAIVTTCAIQEAGAVTWLSHRQKHSHSCSFSHLKGDSESAVNLTCMSYDCRRKLVYRHRKNMQAPHRKTPANQLSSNLFRDGTLYVLENTRQCPDIPAGGS